MTFKVIFLRKLVFFHQLGHPLPYLMIVIHTDIDYSFFQGLSADRYKSVYKLYQLKTLCRHSITRVNSANITIQLHCLQLFFKKSMLEEHMLDCCEIATRLLSKFRFIREHIGY